VHAGNQKTVGNAGSQRCLWSNNSEFDSLFPDCFSQRLYICGLDIQVMGYLGGAGIARGTEYFIYLGALG